MAAPAKTDQTPVRGALALAKRVRLMLFDVDGVLTDGMLYLGGEGELIKAFNARDGHGLKMLAQTGVEVGILSSRRSPIVAARARELGIRLVLQGVPDKGIAHARLLARRRLQAEATGFMGDDVLDLPVMTRCGFAATVADAPSLVKKHAHLVARTPGGAGAVREVCEFIMRAQNTLESTMRAYLK